MKFKTNFINRFFNINPKICIYDLDGTIINSSHRSKFDENDILLCLGEAEARKRKADEVELEEQ